MAAWLKVLLVVSGLLVLCFLYLQLPFSAVKRDYEEKVRQSQPEQSATELFSEELLQQFPLSLQNFYRVNGYLSKPLHSAFSVRFEDVKFVMGEGKPTLKMLYLQTNRATPVERVAYMQGKLFGIPFEGLDYYDSAEASMTGTIGRHFRLFREEGREMAQSGLVTYLSDILWLPKAALELPIRWEQVSENQVRGTLLVNGLSVSGVFTLNDLGEMVVFESEDRLLSLGDGQYRALPWKVMCADYVELNRIRMPSRYAVFWIYPDGEQLYLSTEKIWVDWFD